MTMIARISLGAALAAIAVAANADPLDDLAPDHVIAQMQCAIKPYPVTFAAYLAKRSLIVLKDNIGADSTSCWKLNGTYDLSGLPVSRLCVSEDDPFMVALYPDIFYRGPGTSPGTQLILITSLNEEDAKAWAAANNIASSAVTPSIYVEGQVDITCNDFDK